MKKLILILSFCISLGINAQDHLQPVDSFFNLPDYENEYFSLIKKHLYVDTNFYTASYLVLPSFKPEYLLTTQINNGKFFLFLNESEKNIWYSKNRKNIKIKHFKNEISENHFKLINELFQSAIKTVKFPTEEIIGTDGETYYFSIDNFGIKSGKIWSPFNETKMGRLVRICDTLVELTKQKSNLTEINVNKIQELIFELK